MFRITAKSHSDPIMSDDAVENNSSQMSHWRPALRRIKKKLFLGKEETKIAEEPHCAKKTPPISGLFKRGNFQILDERSPLSGDGNGTIDLLPVVSPTWSKSEPSENPDKSKRMSFLRRTSSKHSINAVSDAPTAPTTRTNFKRQGPINDLRMPTIPITQAYALGRGEQDPPPEPIPRLQRERSKAAYIPQHAASDFSKINSVSHRPGITRRHTTIQAYKNHEKIKAAKRRSQIIDTDSTELPARESQILDDNVDFQLFLASSRLAAAQRYNRGLLPLSANAIAAVPGVSGIMDVIATNHNATARERAISAPQRRPSQRRAGSISMAGSVIGRMGEYLKPTFPEEGRIPRRTFTEHHEEGGSVTSPDFLDPPVQADEKRRKRWSMVSGTFHVSDIHRDDENMSFQSGVRETEKQRKRRSLIMPTSPGLKKYNRAVKDTYI
ncbi:hypothetical protein BGZ60DRAFT_249667 [Tricladium varicosporioides]|nr:hypothetical protein BGZ60DRAFT_249667 [Hymenoscyphus varicosporioides]